MNICDEVKQKLVLLEAGETIQDKSLLLHLSECAHCQSYQQSCHELNQALDLLPGQDASDALVESTLNSLVNLQAETKDRFLNPSWASGLAASFVLFSLIGLYPYSSIPEFNPASSGSFALSNENFGKQKTTGSHIKRTNLKDAQPAFTLRRESKQAEDNDLVVAEQNTPEPKSKPKVSSLVTASPDAQKKDFASKPIDKEFYELEEELADSSSVFEKDGFADQPALERKLIEKTKRLTPTHKSSFSIIASVGKTENKANISQDLETTIKVKIAKRREQVLHSRDNKTIGKLESIAERQDIALKTQQTTSLVGLLAGEKTEGSSDLDSLTKNFPTTEKIIPFSTKPQNPAKQFLAELQSSEGLRFKNPTGYWANTYLPGDPDMRWIGAHLQQWDPLRIGTVKRQGFDFNDSVRQNIQPFDHPDTSALAVYLSSDHKTIQGPTRMRVQLGLQASKRQGGHRPAMNIGLVFDLHNKNNLAGKMKSILQALLKAKQAGDKVSLTIAGASGGMLLEAEDFRHGPIQVALNKIFNNKKPPIEDKALTLKQALQKATQWIRQHDDASVTLGSSVILLFTDHRMGDEITEIESIIHQNALDGINLSTISLGQHTDRQQLDRLALAGQGHSRVLQSADDAKRLINAELLASSRAVARAVRLRIRLAKGVQLIDVLGSYNLDEQAAQKVRDAEQSLDIRMSKNLGISQDRGADEAGIQIVIPSFFAGDTHVVVLDVLVDRPGSIADVTVKYKDLLYLRNAISRKNLHLESGEHKRGPLQLNVLKNILASRFSQSLKEASGFLQQDQNNRAFTILTTMLQLLQSMRDEIPGWKNDQEILKDEQTLKQYIALLRSATLHKPEQKQQLEYALNYISWRKQVSQTKQGEFHD